jgi:V8-like Glu-specific endopeptidase
MQRNRALRIVVASCGLAISTGLAHAQTPATPPSFTVDYPFDSGALAAPGVFTNGMPETVLSSVEVTIPGAAWLRLKFGAGTSLSGDPASDNATFVRITSIADGSVQQLNAEQFGFWSGTSAYFNGETVVVELVGYPGTGESRLVLEEVTAGDPPFGERSICGPTDDRTLTNEARSARHSVGCTSWLINDLNTGFLTAAHCGTSASSVMMFNVPLSASNGALVNPPATEQYVTDGASIQNSTTVELGNDWTYFATSVNSQTGLTAGQVQNSWYTLGTDSGAVNLSHVIRVTGYGTVSSPVSSTWNQVQKTHTGQYTYRTSLLAFSGGSTGRYIGYTPDTTGGNSGSAVLNETTGLAIGVHTNAGCYNGGGYNTGTAIENSGLQAALANPLGLAKSGKAAVSTTGGIYVIGDGANNFGTINTSTGSFAKVSRPALPSPQGMAWDWANRAFWAVDLTPSNGARRLWSITTAGVATQVVTLSGQSGTINGLAFDPNTRTLYGMIASSGQLVRVNTSSGAVTTVGAPQGGSVGGLDFDPINNILYAVNDVAGVGSRLERVNTTNGTRTVVGVLGAGIQDCNGLAYSRKGDKLFTVNAGNEQVLSINPATGAATVVGATGGFFGSGYGLGYVDRCPADIDADGQSDLVDFFAFLNGFDQSLPDGDANLDGEIDLTDFFLFLNYFDQGC